MSLQIHTGASPFFSIVLCTYNRAHLLPRALDSLLAQDEQDWEAVIVDDGSTDNTSALVREYIARAPNIRYLYHRNRGLAHARNAGILAAAGRYITFLDSDDAYTPEHLRIRREYLEANPEIDLLHGGCQIIGNPYVPDKYDPTRRVNLHDLIIGATFCLRKETLIELGGFPNVPFSIDSALFENIQAAGLKILKIDAPTYIYDRTPPDSMLNLVAAGGVEALRTYQRTGHITRAQTTEN